MPTLVSLLPSDLARTRGGAERYAFELHRALGRELAGWRMRGLVAATSSPERHVPPGWSVVGGPFTRRLSAGDAIGAGAALRHTLHDADVVLSHQWRTRSATALRIACALRPGTTLVGLDEGGGTRLGYVLSWLPVPEADIAAHLCDFEASISPVKAPRHITIRGGVDDERFRPAPGVPPTIDFLMVGRFLPYKGQLRFVEALPDGATALLIGPYDSTDPGYRDSVVAAARARGVEVRFDVSDAELAAAYRDARHTVQVPIDFRRYEKAAPPELLGLTMLEAMASGSVPICPGTGASAEFVTDGVTGRTYEAGSEAALANVLRQAMAEDDAYPALRAAALRESERWTWAAAARALVGALGVEAGTGRSASPARARA